MKEMKISKKSVIMLFSTRSGEKFLPVHIGQPFLSPQIGETDSHKSFLLEVSWGDDYPSSPPTISLDAFYNKHL
jgi:hypothetical protein